jgi:hypothetical protein
VAQLEGPEFKPQYCGEKKKKKGVLVAQVVEQEVLSLNPGIPKKRLTNISKTWYTFSSKQSELFASRETTDSISCQ